MENFLCQRLRGEQYYKRRRQIFSRVTFTQPTITCSKLTIETVEQGVKYVQS